MAFKAEAKGYEPANEAEKKLLAKLADHQGQDKVWNLRHSHNLDFSLTPEARYFQPDGTANPAALLQKGLTGVSVSKSEVTNTAAVVAAIAGALSDYQATRPPPEIRRRGGRPPRKAPSRPRAHRRPRLSDAEAAPGPLIESPHKRGVQRGGWRPPRRARGWTALQSEDGQ
jgi:hypothetical protein